jgi:hypothetical protein
MKISPARSAETDWATRPAVVGSSATVKLAVPVADHVVDASARTASTVASRYTSSPVPVP